MESARVIIQVDAGVIPEQPEPEFTRRYSLTSSEWEEAEAKVSTGAVLAELNGRAQGYAMMLMMYPNRFNWVRCDWIWL